MKDVSEVGSDENTRCVPGIEADAADRWWSADDMLDIAASDCEHHVFVDSRSVPTVQNGCASVKQMSAQPEVLPCHGTDR